LYIQDFLFFDEFSGAPATHVVAETGVFWISAWMEGLSENEK
jgi:hypothetical protein